MLYAFGCSERCPSVGSLCGCPYAWYHFSKQSSPMVKRLSAFCLLLLLSIFSSSTGFAQKAKRAPAQKSSVSRKQSVTAEATLHRFYMEYIRSFDRMYEPEQVDSLILAHVTPEAKAKLERVRAMTDLDPILRSQDIASGMEHTLKIRSLGQDWYQVSFGEGEGYQAIPLRVKKVGTKYLIDFITPPWHETAYGDRLLSNPFASVDRVDESSPMAFVLSFYKRYISAYLAMKPTLKEELKALRDRYCTPQTIQLYYDRLASTGEVESGYFDVLIDNTDFDPTWCSSLSVRPSSSSDLLEVLYNPSSNHRTLPRKLLVRAIRLATGGYRLDLQP